MFEKILKAIALLSNKVDIDFLPFLIGFGASYYMVKATKKCQTTVTSRLKIKSVKEDYSPWNSINCRLQNPPTKQFLPHHWPLGCNSWNSFPHERNINNVTLLHKSTKLISDIRICLYSWLIYSYLNKAWMWKSNDGSR